MSLVVVVTTDVPDQTLDNIRAEFFNITPYKILI